jgi:hypothetical protein
MNPMDAHTRELLAGSVRKLLAAAPAGGSVRAALAELGWDDVLADDPAAATTILFTEQGRMLARTRALEDPVLAELTSVLGPSPAGRAWVHPHPAALNPADAAPAAGPATTGLVTGGLDGVTELVVPLRVGHSVHAAVVGVDAVLATPLDTFDRDLGWSRITLVEEPTAPVELGVLWPAAVAAARRALAAEILGIGRAMLELAVEHTRVRTQFGRPIASFQAVRHRLAEAHTALAGCAELLEAAWVDGSPWSAGLAKQSAGHRHAEVSRHALQVCGAIGLSEEHRLHRYVSRGVVLDALYVSHQLLDEQIGRQLLAQPGTALPRVVQL